MGLVQVHYSVVSSKAKPSLAKHLCSQRHDGNSESQHGVEVERVIHPIAFAFAPWIEPAFSPLTPVSNGIRISTGAAGVKVGGPVDRLDLPVSCQ